MTYFLSNKVKIVILLYQSLETVLEAIDFILGLNHTSFCKRKMKNYKLEIQK